MTSNQAEEFLLFSNESVGQMSHSDYERAKPIIDAVKAIARCCHQSIYIIDYFRKGFLFASDTLATICGETKEMLSKEGYNLYIKHVPEDELKILREINEAGFEFFKSIPLSDRMEYSLSYNYHLINRGTKNLTHHKFTPLLLAPDGRIWLAMCLVSCSTKKKFCNVILKKEGCRQAFQYNLKAHAWEPILLNKLSDREREVLMLSAQGYTMREIADILFITESAVKMCKKNLFKTLGVRSITEAFAYAMNHRLL